MGEAPYCPECEQGRTLEWPEVPVMQDQGYYWWCPQCGHTEDKDGDE